MFMHIFSMAMLQKTGCSAHLTTRIVSKNKIGETLVCLTDFLLIRSYKLSKGPIRAVHVRNEVHFWCILTVRN